jgi:hypothetical protein
VAAVLADCGGYGWECFSYLRVYLFSDLADCGLGRRVLGRWLGGWLGWEDGAACGGYGGGGPACVLAGDCFDGLLFCLLAFGFDAVLAEFGLALGLVLKFA